MIAKGPTRRTDANTGGGSDPRSSLPVCFRTPCRGCNTRCHGLLRRQGVGCRAHWVAGSERRRAETNEEPQIIQRLICVAGMTVERWPCGRHVGGRSRRAIARLTFHPLHLWFIGIRVVNASCIGDALTLPPVTSIDVRDVVVVRPRDLSVVASSPFFRGIDTIETRCRDQMQRLISETVRIAGRRQCCSLCPSFE